MSPKAEITQEAKCFGGYYRKYTHESKTLDCTMRFSVYLPPQGRGSEDLPAVYFLSGLTCTEDNFISKAGALRCASRLGMIIVCPDTSPRGVDIPGQDDSYDFGSGAGFYVDATQEPWSKHYRMYSYVTKELPEIVNAILPVDPERVSIFGHSMGGHGALICALKNPGKYKSVSAFAPICNPSKCPWGIKAFSGYLSKEDQQAWKAYDATELVGSYNGPELDILIDQGTEDNFYKDGQLLPGNFRDASAGKVEVTLRTQEGYDHSYWFIQSFVEEHLEHHARYLQPAQEKLVSTEHS
ncbi:MAG: Alpha/Beta hydrolase protein [Piptocephalis tieghemiana]|nr:MAG: Alpha/Beta hydrolase protein [Piptocephalis tieghemiana]